VVQQLSTDPVDNSVDGMAAKALNASVVAAFVKLVKDSASARLFLFFK